MGNKNHAIRLLIATFVISFISIVCFALGFSFNEWWVTETNTEKTTVGLREKCTFYFANATKTCVERELFIFSKKGLDPIVICLIISAGCTVFILLASLSISICCRTKTSLWHKTNKWMTFFVIISFVAAIDGMIYTELEFKDILSNATRGWAYMITWAGTGLQFILFVLIIVQLCVKPPRTVDTMPW